MASEYWIVVDKDDVLMTDWVGDIGEMADTESDALKRASYFDDVWTEDAPHRVVHLIAAGTVDDGDPPEGDLTTKMKVVVQSAEKVTRLGGEHQVTKDEWVVALGAMYRAVAAMTKSQLRACGVDNDKETDDG